MSSDSDRANNANKSCGAPRSGPWRRAQLHVGYLWRNSGHAVIRKFHTTWDTRSYHSFDAVRSDLGGLSVAYAGVTDGLAYALDFVEQRRTIEGGPAACRTSAQLKRSHWRDVGRILDSDIALVGTSAVMARQLPQERSFLLPMRVHFVVNFDEDTDRVLARIARGERRNFRQSSRRHRWDLHVDTNPAWFDDFYEKYYRATMARRHGERERVESQEAAYECLFRRGKLFVLDMDRQRVAGHLCHWNRRSGVLTSRLLGVLDGADEHYSAGALKAMHFLLIEWAGNRGVRQLDFQGTEAFVSKGTYQLKRLFGTRVVLPPNHFGDKRLWLHIRRDTGPVRDFLVANPFISERRDGELEAVYFYDEQRPVRSDYPANSPGIAAARHINLDHFLAGLADPTNAHEVPIERLPSAPI